MLRRLATFAACVVFLGVVPRTGSLFVSSLPTGADVWVDGTYIGRSPVFADALAAGRHTIGLARAGWSAQQVEATVVAGQTTLSSLRLEPAQGVPLAGGTLAIHGIDVSAVFIDGVAVARGKEGTYPASAGSHELSVRTARGKLTRAVTVWPQTRTDVVLQTTTAAERPSVVAPADAYLVPGAVVIDGDKIVIRAPGHEATAHLGSTSYRVDGRMLEYDSPPTLIGQRLYLPIDLLKTLTTAAR